MNILILLFISSAIILNVIHNMILLCIYQCLHLIHCHSASIAMNYTISSAKCRFRCHDWCKNTQNISCYSCKNRLLSTFTFSPTQNIIISCLIPLKNSLFHTDIIIKHPISGYRIGYGSNIVFTISVFAPNFRIRIRIRIWRIWKNDISICQNRISEMNRILANWMRIIRVYQILNLPPSRIRISFFTPSISVSKG